MKQVIIGFSRPKEFKVLAKLIMLNEKTNYSHAYIKFNALSFDRSLIYQASGKQVNFEGSVHFNTHAILVEEYEISIEDDLYKRLMQFCIDNAGIPYGLKATIGLVWVKINKLFGKKIDNPFNDGDASLFCSELAYNCLKLINESSDTDIGEDISPKDLNDLIKNNQNIKRIL